MRRWTLLIDDGIEMKKGKPVALIGAAALAAAFVAAAISMSRGEEAAPKPVPESNRFPFLKPPDATASAGCIGNPCNDALVIDADLRRLFDRHLSAAGTRSPAAIRAEAEHELAWRFKPDGVKEASGLLRRYLDYRNALAESEKNARPAEEVEEAIHSRLTVIRQARARFFSAEEIQGLFGSDDIEAIVRAELDRNRSLRDAQKQERLVALTVPMKVAATEQSIQEMRIKGAGEDAIYRARATALSPQTAVRLAQLDQAEAMWKARVSVYLAERNRLSDGTETAAEANQSHVLQQLRDAHFTSEEQRRLTAYESSGAPQLR